MSSNGTTFRPIVQQYNSPQPLYSQVRRPVCTVLCTVYSDVYCVLSCRVNVTGKCWRGSQPAGRSAGQWSQGVGPLLTAIVWTSAQDWQTLYRIDFISYSNAAPKVLHNSEVLKLLREREAGQERARAQSAPRDSRNNNSKISELTFIFHPFPTPRVWE